MWWIIALPYIVVVAVAAVMSGVYDVVIMHHDKMIRYMGMLATTVGVGFAAFALWRKNRLTSVNFATQALKEFAEDADMQCVFYDIEHKRFGYPGGNKGSSAERMTDRLLRHFAAVALAWENGLVKPGDLVLIRYYVVKAMRDPNVTKYLNKVCRNLAKGNIEHPYAVLKRFHEYLEKSPDFPDSAGTKR